MFDLGSVVHYADIFVSPFMGFELMNASYLIAGAGYILQYAAILFILWIRFGESIMKIRNRSAKAVQHPASEQDQE
jgi:uncharacterized membrane protein